MSVPNTNISVQGVNNRDKVEILRYQVQKLWTRIQKSWLPPTPDIISSPSGEATCARGIASHAMARLPFFGVGGGAMPALGIRFSFVETGRERGWDNAHQGFSIIKIPLGDSLKVYKRKPSFGAQHYA